MKVIIEIPKGSKHKYEYDKLTGGLYLDRIINHPYPHNYGFVPNTLCWDGDPMDVFVVSDEPIAPLATVSIELKGIVLMDDNGVSDPKLYGTVVGDTHIYSPHDIVKFLKTYKPGVEVRSVEGLGFAEYHLQESFKRFYNKNIEGRNCI